ncbi:glycosyltransferase family 4 protein [Enterococcus cecorum]|uniref:glycosyltransferase family 4 protein n=1 Tax=Enterococcus cecorum TaxID=44008 RepID=UPI00148C11E0|nr:glycosyltransferase family 4 protein [Enterococcus cecorum]
MKKRILIVATIDRHIEKFHLPYIKEFKKMGYEVHVATNGYKELENVDKKITIPIQRTPFSIKNIFSIFELRRIIKKNNYEIIHCHTPMGSVVTRLAAKNIKKVSSPFVVYTAHGFHFFKGASKVNWLIYYNIEKVLSKYTDLILTINNEDYKLAKEKFYCNIEYVPGVGIDLSKFIPKTESLYVSNRKKIGISNSSFVITYVAELSNRKNQEVLIRAMSRLCEKYDNLKLYLIGDGPNVEEYKNLVKQLNLEDDVIFSGYQSDVTKYLYASDMLVSSSKQEGLPVNILEGMSIGLPIVVSNCRGNIDLIKNGYNGLIVENDSMSFEQAIEKIFLDKNLRDKLGEKNLLEIKKYSLQDVVNQTMEKIFTTKEGRDN